MAKDFQIGLILLAAGLSRRMGGPNKLLQLYRGEPLVAHALKAAAGVNVVDRIVVTGRDALEIEAIASRFDFRPIHNSGFERGLGSSIAVGAAAMTSRLAGFFIALGDMPDVRASDYLALANAFRPGAIIVPVYRGARGHPVLFCASYQAELAGLTGDAGAKRVILAHARAVEEIETGNPGVLRDLDVAEDFLDPA